MTSSAFSHEVRLDKKTCHTHIMLSSLLSFVVLVQQLNEFDSENFPIARGRRNGWQYVHSEEFGCRDFQFLTISRASLKLTLSIKAARIILPKRGSTGISTN